MPWWTEPMGGSAGKMFIEAMASTGIGVQKVSFGSVGDDPAERGATFVMLAGDRALSMYRPDLRVAHCHGRPMRSEDNLHLFPVFHPEAYFRNPRWRSLLEHELALLMRLARDPEGWLSEAPQSCVKCRGSADYVDTMGVVYCNEHLKSRSQP